MEDPKFIWTISQLERTKNDDTVFAIHYRVSLSCKDCFVETYGSVGLPPADPETKIPYDELSEELVLDWIKNILGEEFVREMENSLMNQLQYTKNPNKELGIPWMKNNLDNKL
jgi:hypothetical protein